MSKKNKLMSSLLLIMSPFSYGNILTKADTRSKKVLYMMRKKEKEVEEKVNKKIVSGVEYGISSLIAFLCAKKLIDTSLIKYYYPRCELNPEKLIERAMVAKKIANQEGGDYKKLTDDQKCKIIEYVGGLLGEISISLHWKSSKARRRLSRALLNLTGLVQFITPELPTSSENKTKKFVANYALSHFNLCLQNSIVEKQVLDLLGMKSFITINSSDLFPHARTNFEHSNTWKRLEPPWRGSKNGTGIFSLHDANKCYAKNKKGKDRGIYILLIDHPDVKNNLWSNTPCLKVKQNISWDDLYKQVQIAIRKQEGDINTDQVEMTNLWHASKYFAMI